MPLRLIEISAAEGHLLENSFIVNNSPPPNQDKLLLPLYKMRHFQENGKDLKN